MLNYFSQLDHNNIKTVSFSKRFEALVAVVSPSGLNITFHHIFDSSFGFPGEGPSFSYLSMNANGHLNDFIGTYIDMMEYYDVDILSLQDTGLISSSSKAFCSNKQLNILMSSSPPDVHDPAGHLCIISKNKHKFSNSSAHYRIQSISILELNISIWNVYVPPSNKKHPELYTNNLRNKIIAALSNPLPDNCWVTGDFNDIAEPVLDRSPCSSNHVSKFLRLLSLH
jgi:hypothetical protein